MRSKIGPWHIKYLDMAVANGKEHWVTRLSVDGALISTRRQQQWWQCVIDISRRLWHATHDCVAPYVDIILHRGRF